MSSSGPTRSPLHEVAEVMVYAPLGLLYEYPEVLPKLVARGKSQVQLAKVLGQMAARQAAQQTSSGASTGPEFGAVLAEALTAVGRCVGLAPPADPDPKPADAEPTEPTAEPNPTTDQPAPAASAAILDGYDTRTARDIIAWLGDLSPEERALVEAHERAGKHRVTILRALERLAS